MNLSVIVLAVSLLVCVNASAKQQPSKTNAEKRYPARSFSDGTSDASIVRQLIHDTNFIGLANQYYSEEFKGYAGTLIQLIADGPIDNGTGIPYFFIHKNDANSISAKLDSRASVFVNEAIIDGRCNNFPLGHKDDACPRAELFGHLVQIQWPSQEWYQALGWLQDKFVGFKNLGVTELEYDLWKLDIEQILIRTNSEPTHVSVDDYLTATPAVWID